MTNGFSVGTRSSSSGPIDPIGFKNSDEPELVPTENPISTLNLIIQNHIDRGLKS
jgi:hypothetical protein